jgi:hypothetical protein
MESGGGATMVYAVEARGEKLVLVLIGGDRAGHSRYDSVTLSRIPN